MGDKTKLIELLQKAKGIFDEYLLDRDFLYVYQNKRDGKIESFEMKCIKGNFLHLTGVKTTIKASDFYKNLEKNRISLKDIDYKSDGTTKLKLEIFERLPLLLSTPVQVCFQDNFFTLKLQVDILLNRPILTQKDIVLGLKKKGNYDFYVPSSMLKVEPQKIGKDFSRVLLIMEKKRFEKEYIIIRYQAKNIEVEKLLNEIGR